mgnify:CR=1 FL=1
MTETSDRGDRQSAAGTGSDDSNRWRRKIPRILLSRPAAILGAAGMAGAAALVAAVDAREAIILTRPHVVAEFFHVDWTSRARRKLGVPVLHLIEHENFDEQASGSGEGVTGV